MEEDITGPILCICSWAGAFFLLLLHVYDQNRKNNMGNNL